MLEHDERGDEPGEPGLPDALELLDELAAHLDAAGVAARDEVERQVPGCDLFWLTLAGLDAL